MAKEISPLDTLEQNHLKESADRSARIATAMKEVRDLESMLAGARAVARRLQGEQINASFAYDTARDRLVAESRTVKAAA